MSTLIRQGIISRVGHVWGLQQWKCHLKPWEGFHGAPSSLTPAPNWWLLSQAGTYTSVVCLPIMRRRLRTSSSSHALSLWLSVDKWASFFSWTNFAIIFPRTAFHLSILMLLNKARDETKPFIGKDSLSEVLILGAQGRSVYWEECSLSCHL